MLTYYVLLELSRNFIIKCANIKTNEKGYKNTKRYKIKEETDEKQKNY